MIDVLMPRMSGPQLGQQLATLVSTIRVLYMSGYPNDVVQQMDGKPTAFIAKPFSATDLAKKVRQTLAA